MQGARISHEVLLLLEHACDHFSFGGGTVVLPPLVGLCVKPLGRHSSRHLGVEDGHESDLGGGVWLESGQPREAEHCCVHAACFAGGLKARREQAPIKLSY